MRRGYVAVVVAVMWCALGLLVVMPKSSWLAIGIWLASGAVAFWIWPRTPSRT